MSLFGYLYIAMSFNMIDPDTRRKLSEGIRSLVSGNITNDEFEELVPDSEDKAIYEIFQYGAWRLYSDLKVYKLKGKNALPIELRPEIARWVLFLKTDYEYSWPEVSAWAWLLSLITLGLWNKVRRLRNRKYGDINVWPFISKLELEKAKTTFGYLGIQNS